MKLRDIGEQIASATLEWRGPDGSKCTVLVTLGKPRPLEDSSGFYCPLCIGGLGDEQPKYAVGIDGIQAIALALRMIQCDLEALQAELMGELSWQGGKPGDLTV